MATKFNVALRDGNLFSTEDATPVVAFTFQSRKGRSYWFEIKVQAIYADFSASASYWRQAAFKTLADGTLAQVGSTRTVVTDNESTGSMDVSVAASGTEIQVTVTGVAATDIFWRGEATIIELDDKSAN